MRDGDFTKFLEFLSPDPDEAGQRYLQLHHQLVGFFTRREDVDPDEAADLTLDRAAKKIAEGADVPEIKPFCFGIARYIKMERARADWRITEAAREFMRVILDRSDEELERIYRSLLPCFEQLSADEKELMIGYCHILQGREKAEERRRLAERRKSTMLGLRMRVTRIRTALEKCVKKRAYAG
jgi:hypothetical protein